MNGLTDNSTEFCISETSTILLNIQLQYKAFHWQTRSRPEHDAYGFIYDSLDDLIDKFVESAMGSFERPTFVDPIILENYEDCNCEDFCAGVVAYLLSFNNCLGPEHSDLLNIRDEMLGAIKKLNYLLTLK